MAETTLSGQNTIRFLQIFGETKFDITSECSELGQKMLESRDATLDGATNAKKTRSRQYTICASQLQLLA
jgi:hypothetical protein